MKIGKIVIVNTDDFEGVYMDGQLITQNHSVSLEEFFDAIGIEVETFYDETDYNGDGFPQNLSDVSSYSKKE